MIKKISFVSGAAGFIGSSLIAELVRNGKHVVVVDDLSNGSLSNIQRLLNTGLVSFYNADLSSDSACDDAFAYASTLGKIDEVWHLAANSDIPSGVSNIEVDLKDTFLTTVSILKTMKANEVRSIYFASSSAIYGDLGDVLLTEESGPLLPISNYGAMKLASEAAISAASESYLDIACIFRFPNVVGFPATHGVIFDFMSRLKSNAAKLTVLGNGTQQKSYLHVSDLVSAMLFIANSQSINKIKLFNIGPIDRGVSVKWIAEQVIKRVSPQAKISYGTADRGWVGDVPKFNYSTAKLQQLGWQPLLGSEKAILLAIDEIAVQMGM
jgi:UDP-glucose 4-epimerase